MWGGAVVETVSCAMRIYRVNMIALGKANTHSLDR